MALALMHDERFIDMAPAAIFHSLLDEGRHVCSIRTLYRILDEHKEVRERRNQRRHVNYAKPELLATGPNQVWTWDITKLRGPVRGLYYYLYVIIDIYSRYVTGWMIARHESGALARRFIEETCAGQNIRSHQLALHADRGSSMKSCNVSQLLADLGVLKSHSRPRVSNDNPFSESQFKTLKYRPDFPGRFVGYEAAREFCRSFFEWYNNHHFHSSICYLPPTLVHYGKATAALEARNLTRQLAYAQNPERYRCGPPEPLRLPEAVWINPPTYHRFEPTDSALQVIYG